MEGILVGADDGLADGSPDGVLDGAPDGAILGEIDGRVLGLIDGIKDNVGDKEGSCEIVGLVDGTSDGKSLGIMDGMVEVVGPREGISVGFLEGAELVDGMNEGLFVMKESDASSPRSGFLNSVGNEEGMSLGKSDGLVDILGSIEIEGLNDGSADTVGNDVGSREDIADGPLLIDGAYVDGSVDGRKLEEGLSV